MVAGAPQMRICRYCRDNASTSAEAGATANAPRISGPCSATKATPARPPTISARSRMALRSTPSPAPCACAVSPEVPIRRKPKTQYRVANTTAPNPTAPIGAASPNCPTTPVSTAPNKGTVALDNTIGTAMRRTRRWVSSVIPQAHPATGASGSGRCLGQTAARGCLAMPRHERMRSAAPTAPPLPAHRHRAAIRCAGNPP